LKRPGEPGALLGTGKADLGGDGQRGHALVLLRGLLDHLAQVPLHLGCEGDEVLGAQPVLDQISVGMDWPESAWGNDIRPGAGAVALLEQPPPTAPLGRYQEPGAVKPAYVVVDPLSRKTQSRGDLGGGSRLCGGLEDGETERVLHQGTDPGAVLHGFYREGESGHGLPYN
jgi:hypothetical protein